MLQALAQQRCDREIWGLHGARNGGEHAFATEARALLGSLPNARSHVYYSRPGPKDVNGRDVDSAGRLTASVLTKLTPPMPRPTSVGPKPSWTKSARVCRLRFRCLPHPYRAVRADSAARRRGSPLSLRGRPTRPPASPETAPQSHSRVATSRSHGAATTAPCSNSPSPAMYPYAGHVEPASAIPAKRRSSRGMSNTVPSRLNLPLREACSSAARSHATT